jgi:hypothetical protein
MESRFKQNFQGLEKTVPTLGKPENQKMGAPSYRASYYVGAGTRGGRVLVERQISPLVEQPKNENFKTLAERAAEANKENR